MERSAGLTIGPYELLAPIGAGGMGEVWRAFDGRLQRAVAVKFSFEAATERVLREARAIAALNHPNILTIFDIGEHDGQFYTVTELLEGETLRSRLDRGRLTWREAAEIGHAISEGLAASHQRGIVHRDIKPANLFLCRDRTCKILDFGLAHDQHPAIVSDVTIEVTRPGMVLGTVGYMAPEQMRGEPANAASDLFALGCVPYECCAGSAPFRRPTGAESIAALLHESPPPLDTPGGLRHVVERCLVKDPLQRIQSAREVANLLRETLTGSETRSQNPAQTIEAIAVLPFANSGGNADADFLCDGVAESILNQLARLPGLRVVPRAISFPLRGRESETGTLSAALGVRALLTGRMAVRGDQFQIQVELLDLQSRSQLWGDRFRGSFEDIFDAEEKIATSICERLRVRLSSRDQQRLAARGSRNPKAYEYYLRGRAFAIDHSPPSTMASLQSFQAALDEDPEYTDALAGYAHALVWLSDWRIGLPVERLTQARQLAERALAIDPEHIEAAVVLGRIRISLDLDWPGSERLLRDSVTRDPYHALACQTMSMVLTAASEFDLAFEYGKRAMRLDPSASFLPVSHGTMLLMARRCEEGLAFMQRQLAGRPDHIPCLAVLHWNAVVIGRFEESMKAAVRLEELLRNFEFAGLFKALVLGAMGRQEEARAVLAAYPMGQSRPNAAYAFAHAGLIDEAFSTMESSVRQGFWEHFFLHLDPRVDVLRSDARFQPLLDCIGVNAAVQRARRQGWKPLPLPHLD